MNNVVTLRPPPRQRAALTPEQIAELDAKLAEIKAVEQALRDLGAAYDQALIAMSGYQVGDELEVPSKQPSYEFGWHVSRTIPPGTPLKVAAIRTWGGEVYLRCQYRTLAGEWSKHTGTMRIRYHNPLRPRAYDP